MSLNVLLFVLRVAFLVLLYVFLFAVVRTAWSGVRATAAIREAVVPPASRVRLRVIRAGKQDLVDQSFELWSSATLGRAPDNTIVLPEGTVSAHHATIRQDNGQWWLQDLNSTNGSAVNEQWLTRPAMLYPGDIVRLGDVSLRLEVDEPVRG